MRALTRFWCVLIAAAVLLVGGPHASAADIDDLRRTVRSGTPQQRLSALESLRRISKSQRRFGEPQPVEAIPELIGTVCGEYETPGTEWSNELPHEAAAVLGSIGKPAMNAVVPLLEHQRQKTRFFAAVALGHMKATAQPAVPALCKAIGSSTDRVRASIFGALEQIGITTEAALDTTIWGAKKGGTDDVKIAATRALGSAEVNVPLAAASATEVLLPPTLDAAFGSIMRLGTIGFDVMLVGWSIVKPESRAWVLDEVVRQTGPYADPKLELTEEQLERLLETARAHASTSLERRASIIIAGRLDMLSDDDIRDMRFSLRSGDDERVKIALETLSQMPASAGPMIAELILLLEHLELPIVEYTLSLLANMGAAARPALQAIARVAREEETLEAKAKSAIVVIRRGGPQRR